MRTRLSVHDTGYQHPLGIRTWDWLISEGWQSDAHVVTVELVGEGAVRLEVLSDPLEQDAMGDLVTYWVEFPVRSLPPFVKA